MIFITRKPIDLACALVGTTNTSVINTITVLVLFLVMSSPLYVLSAYSDGLFQDQISASVGERKVGLSIKMTPPIITTETLKKGQKPTIEFRVFNSNNNGTYFHVTYQILMQKGNQTLLNQWFNQHCGRRFWTKVMMIV